MTEQQLSQMIELKMREIEAITGSDPWVTRTPGEAANYIAGYTKALEDAAAALETVQAEERERCARIAVNGCLVPPDGGSPTQDEVRMCDHIAVSIRNPKSR